MPTYAAASDDIAKSSARRPPLSTSIRARSASRSTRRSASRQGADVTGRHQQRVHIVGRHVAVPVERARDHRGPRRHRLDQHDTERLAVQRRRTEHRRAAQAGELVGVGDPSEPFDPVVVTVLGSQAPGVGTIAGDPARRRRDRCPARRRAARRGPCVPRGDRRRRSPAVRDSYGTTERMWVVSTPLNSISYSPPR